MSQGSIVIGDEEFDKAYIQSDSDSDNDSEEGGEEEETSEDEEEETSEEEEEEDEDDQDDEDDDDDDYNEGIENEDFKSWFEEQSDDDDESSEDASLETSVVDDPFQVVPANSPPMKAVPLENPESDNLFKALRCSPTQPMMAAANRPQRSPVPPECMLEPTHLDSFTANAGFGDHVMVVSENTVTAADDFEITENSDEDDEEEYEEERGIGEEFEDEPSGDSGAKQLSDPKIQEDIEADLTHREVIVRYRENTVVKRLCIIVGCLIIPLATAVILLFAGGDEESSQSSREPIFPFQSPIALTDAPIALPATNPTALSSTTTPTSSPMTTLPDPPIVAITTDYVIQITSGNAENIPFETFQADLIQSLDLLAYDLWMQASAVTVDADKLLQPAPVRRLGGPTARRRLSTQLKLPTKIASHVEVGTYHLLRGTIVVFGLRFLISLFASACPVTTNIFVRDGDRCEKVTASIEFSFDGTGADLSDFTSSLKQDIRGGELQKRFETLDSSTSSSIRIFVDDNLLPITPPPTMSSVPSSPPTISSAPIAPKTLAPSISQGTGTSMPSSPSTSAPTRTPNDTVTSAPTASRVPTFSPMPTSPPSTSAPTMNSTTTSAPSSPTENTTSVPTASRVPTFSPLPTSPPSTSAPTMNSTATSAPSSPTENTTSVPTASRVPAFSSMPTSPPSTSAPTMNSTATSAPSSPTENTTSVPTASRVPTFSPMPTSPPSTSALTMNSTATSAPSSPTENTTFSPSASRVPTFSPAKHSSKLGIVPSRTPPKKIRH
jgi:hypothetical protein